MCRYFKSIIAFFLPAALLVCGYAFYPAKQPNNAMISYTVDPKKQDLKFYWKNDRQELFRSIHHLKDWLTSKNKTLVFAMNGGMYMEDNSSLGLYIENYITHKKLNTASGSGNFYLKPNGVFYINADNTGYVCKTGDFKPNKNIRYATQSGPMLLADGQINSNFTKGSANLNIRNGVGVLPDNRLVFAMSKEGINLYDFAMYFKELGCKNALYLDGFVSRTYLPAHNWLQTDGNFGVIMAVTE